MTVQVEQFDDLRYLGGVFVDIEQAYQKADYKIPLTEFLKTEQAEESSMFSGRLDPEGNPWQPNAPYTIAKKGHDVTLVETGDLRASLVGTTSESIREVTQRGSLFGTSNDKSLFNQDGTKLIPARPHVGLNDRLLDELCNALADALVEQLKA